MFLREIDILSPEITLFYNHSLSHSSIISGILTIIALVLIVLSSLCFVSGIFNRSNEVPKVSSYSLFIQNSGEFPINSSSFFHFLSLVKDVHHPELEEFDFTYFNLIGLDVFTKDYENDDDLKKYNHWLYGFCNNETDTKGISNVLTQNYFNKSACIRKYFNSTEQKYYDTNEPNFKWPKMAYGTFNPNLEFYSVILIKCNNDILKEVFEGKYTCKNDNEIEKIFKTGAGIHLNFIDQYIDVLNYEQSIKKYVYRIENTLDEENYSINHLNFNPCIIKTYNGYIIEKYEKELTYNYERNDVFTKSKKGNIYMIYSLWINNRVNYYERTYKRIQEILSDVGGIAQAILTIAIIINNFINKYIILYDTEKLLNQNKILVTEICAHKKIVKISNSYNNSNATSFKENYERNSISPETKEEIIEKNNKDFGQRKILESPFYKDGKEFKFEDTKIVDKDFKNGRNDIKINRNKTKRENFSFWDFLVYKFSFGKRNRNIRLFEEFRETVISVENLTKDHLNILNLLKCNDIKKIS